MGLRLGDGRRSFYQWDTNVRLIVTGASAGDQVHFTCATIEEPLSVLIYEENSKLFCDVPDICLQAPGCLVAYTYETDSSDGNRTTYSKVFDVIPREKPPDYIYYNDVEEAIKAHNAELLALTGTDQPTTEEAIIEINATLADTLVGKGVSAEATETTEELADKVEQIHDFAAQYTKSLNFSHTDLYDENAPKHIPNLYCPFLTNITFSGNVVTETVGDIYAPNAGCMQRGFGNTNIKRFGKLTLLNSTSYAFISNPYLEEIEEFNIPLVGNLQSLFKDNNKLVKIGGVLDFTAATLTSEMFRNCVALEEFGVVPNSINVNLASAYLTSCSKLSYDTLTFIKNGLADRTEQTQFTLAIGSANVLKYSTEDLAEILAKNWLVQ